MRVERERAVVIGLEQRLGLLARQRLDAERARQADQRTVETVALDERCARGRRLAGRVEHARPLAGEVQHGKTVLAAHERKLLALL